MSFVQSAFEAVLPDAEQTDIWFVCLVEEVPYYGGPEEGGWWGSDSHCIAFKEYPNKAQADAAAEKIRELAKALAEEARNQHSRYCEVTMDWLEERGLDASFLPEPDGESEYHVLVCQEVPLPRRGTRQYS